MSVYHLRVDWTVHDAHKGEPVVVELHTRGDEPKVIHHAQTPPAGVAWAVKWYKDRGIKYWCDVDMHQRLDHKHVVIMAVPEVTAVPEVKY